MTPQDKINIIDKQLEMIAGSDSFIVNVWTGFPDKHWNVRINLKNGEGDAIVIDVDASDFPSVINEAYTRFRRFLDPLPEFNANKVIEYQPTTAEVLDDEVPF